MQGGELGAYILLAAATAYFLAGRLLCRRCRRDGGEACGEEEEVLHR